MRLIFTFCFLLLTTILPAVAQQKQPAKKPSIQQPAKPPTKKVETGTQKPAPSETKTPAVAKTALLTGVWRGYFVQKQYNTFFGRFIEDRYKYEIQINQLQNNSLQGVTYSYKTTVFYGKTSLQGIYTKSTKNVLIKELKMLELKINDMSDPCMMTCNLEYEKNGSKETMTGTFTSLNMKDKTDCGGGIVYLEKVPESDFEKEDFLTKKKPEPIAPSTTTAKDKVKPLPYNNPTTKTPITPQTPNTPKPKIKPGAEAALVQKKDNKQTPQPIDNNNKVPEAKSTESNVKEEPKAITPAKPLAKELTERSNNLVKTLFVDEGEIELSLYDNGEIDNDTITVYHNNEVVISHGRLSASPLTVRIKVDAQHPTHELVMVANNLGSIPPNTSLMTVIAGKKQYSVFLSSDESRNAKVVIQYKPGQDQSRN